VRHFSLAALLLILCSAPALANPQPFGAWLEAFKRDAQAQGITATMLDQAFATVWPDPRIIRLDRKQPEGSITLDQYLRNTVTQGRVQQGANLYFRHKMLLDEIGAKYGVQPRFIVALWGIETSFGQNTGGFNVIEALATLAYDGRRSQYFREELLKALRIVQEGHISLASMKGSWAGAMGQCQFMPTSFYHYAVDYNGDGHKDIWNSLPDVFASIANYLSTVGWNPDQTWGREVYVPVGFDRTQAGLEKPRSVAEWRVAGVSNLPAQYDELKGDILFPGDGKRAFLVYDNYHTILDWNRSSYFATAVGQLADRIGAATR
jgi:membrane-bound lytic murein transglycosylase B